ncbi:hypothetical protein DB347_11440 [Opitutaceae bacterium EW11]|nr:hypothetical protein DB347_11440 [Opitutaceae bacterium EW11]
MPAAEPSDDSASPAFLEHFRAAAGDRGVLRFDRFVELALYQPEVGYYRRNKPRVGYGPGTDFYTSSTSGPLFGELIVAACKSLLESERIDSFAFAEIGAEPGGGVLEGVAHPFTRVETVRLGAPLTLSGPCVVFSNELLDAQPFRRFVRTEQRWEERGVAIRGTELQEVAMPHGSADLPDVLPPSAPDGYRLDLSFAASQLVDRIAAEPWHGLFLALDYGKTWKELAESTPGGTARAYFRHRQRNDLLARPGEQDLTCHVCWDWIEDALRIRGFKAPRLEFQESFLVHHAGEAIASTMAAEATRMSQRKLSLMQLLHPAHLGQKFQAMYALRGGGT